MPAEPTTPLADAGMARLDDLLGQASNAERATRMRAYMRNQFPYLGIPAPDLSRLARSALPGPLTEADLVALALSCWARPEREYQYVACGYLRRYVRTGTADLLSTVRVLITTKSWWDTVDTLAAHTVGPLVLAYPELLPTMDEWSISPDLWLVRTALLYQLGYRQRTDAERLFRYCARQASHRDFFIRKAIGWALRAYSRTDPVAVRSFVDSHRVVLAPLSVREAVRHI
jgi:3-methyladenine DNA glycosylase AlkD